ncbi:decaprenylphospho-beta-D-ribofuranose 2-oxidase [Streptomyces sp. SAI-135]|uniref:FAD-binding oxidoreductase n=1 Tax=unclassified Streptomyces TaxID=2593676 RepID=UPI002475B212|nr:MULTISPECIES: FAD-binding oxidoreductase [unclassified Streptomyces]MDH6516974.1 decaprenylphospho-beta-D-ribofuranose 2-oxidase [Streptomyces sp. SAI-090]MDH6618937.1 decaprenylphospho-beta-D-ribofuranose 2-oxidase [Streptomyces sp. SAI-135]
MSADTVPVTGWGRTAPTAARPIRLRSYEEAVAAVRGSGARGGIPRGLGRACGDAAQNAGGAVFDVTALNRVHAIDAEGGTVLCDAGVSLHRIMEVLLPLGWFVPVAPGTRYVTVGGAIGADVHGRNHPVSGSFSRHVLSFELLTADGGIRTVRRGTPLFDATTGGMGLTGMILTATVQLQPVETSLMSVATERTRDLDDLMARLTTGDRGHRYSVAWIDLLARGAATGRAVLTRGDHAPLEALEAPGLLSGGPRARRDPLAFRPPRLPAPLALLPAFLPALLPEGLVNRTTVGLFNELRYRRASRARTGRLQRINAFFHPLDGVPHWNRIYGRGGLVRYQFVVGLGQEETLRRIVRRLSGQRCPSALAVLQRFGDADPGWLSFPAPGWTLALDVPAALPGLGALLDALDEEVAAAGGRVCLAEDSRLRPELLAAMYPRLDAFRALRAELDPRGVFTSDLSRRLTL